MIYEEQSDSSISTNSFEIEQSYSETSEKSYFENISLQQELKDTNLQITETLAKHYFQRIQLIGQGIEGKVFLCNYIKKRTASIYKIIKAIKLKGENSRDQFLENFALQTSINYGKKATPKSHVIVAETYFLSKNYAFKIYPYQTSLNLLELLICNNRIFQKQPKLIKKLIKHMLLALIQIHSTGSIHCDIKPNNILLTIDPSVSITQNRSKTKKYDPLIGEQQKSIQNSNLIAINFKEQQKFQRKYHISQLNFKVIDFGHSVKKDNVSRKVPSTIFSAPEILRGDPFGYCSDVWSMGLVIFYVITPGLLPYSGDSIESIKQSLEKEEVHIPPMSMASMRDKAESIANVLSDPSKLEKQREGSRKNRTKICGLGSNAADSKMGSLSTYGTRAGGASGGGGMEGVGNFGGTSGFGSSSTKKKGNDWTSAQSSYYNGGSYDPYVKKTKIMENYEKQKQSEATKSELFTAPKSKPRPKKKNAPGFANRKAQKGQGFQFDDDDDDSKRQDEDQEETKPKKRVSKKVAKQEEAPKSDLLNLDQVQSGGNNSSLFQNMQISSTGQQAAQPNLFQLSQPQQQQQPQNLFSQQQQFTQPIQQQPDTQNSGSLFSQMNMTNTAPSSTTTTAPPSQSLFQNMQIQNNPQPSQNTFTNPTSNSGMFPFINQSAPVPQTNQSTQHPNTINNSTSLVINMTLGQQNSNAGVPSNQSQLPFGQFSIQSNQNIQNPSSNFAQQSSQIGQQQQQLQEPQFGDFNQAGNDEQPIKQEKIKKQDAWKFGSELFNLQNLNEQKNNSKNMETPFSNILQNTQQIGNNLLHTKGQDLNMLWNQPMGMSKMSGPPPSQNQFRGGFQNVMGGMMNQMHQQQQPQMMNPGFGAQQQQGGNAFGFMQQQNPQPNTFGMNPMQSQQQQQQQPQQSQFNFMNQMRGGGSQMMPQQQQQSGFQFMQQRFI